MKKLLLLLTAVATYSYAGTITRPNTYVAGDVIRSADVNLNETTIYDEFNGNIDSANIEDLSIVAGDIANTTITGGKINTSDFSISLATVTALYSTGINVSTITVSSITATGDEVRVAGVNLAFSGSAYGIKGDVSGGSASTGNVGEYVEAYIAAIGYAASGAWSDATFINLSAGDWDVTLHGLNAFQANQTSFSLGISTTTGNTSAGLILGRNNYSAIYPGSTNHNGHGTIANFRLNLNASFTVYAKFRADYTGSTPTFYGRISARRVR